MLWSFLMHYADHERMSEYISPLDRRKASSVHSGKKIVEYTDCWMREIMLTKSEFLLSFKKNPGNNWEDCSITVYWVKLESIVFCKCAAAEGFCVDGSKNLSRFQFQKLGVIMASDVWSRWMEIFSASIMF